MKPEAPAEDPRRVQADRHHRCPACSSASICRGWRRRCTTARSSARCTTASTTPTRPRSTAALTGHDRGEQRAIGTGPNRSSVHRLGRWPCAGRRERRSSPTSRCRTSPRKGPAGRRSRASSAGLLGRAYDPLFVLRDPNAPDFAMPELTLPADVVAERLSTLGSVLSRTLDRQSAPATAAARRRWIGFQARAFDLLTSPDDAEGLSASTASRTACATPTAAISTARACCWRGG